MKNYFLFTGLMLAGLAIQAQTNSPYVKRVFEYRPAPGQFVNELPEYEQGDTPATMAAKAEDALKDNNQVMITLGGYGGYVVVGFDHSIVNVPNQSDFQVLGNAFWSNTNPNPNVSKRAGNAEPGIVVVSVDENKNGLPDDTWYELAGSEYTKPETIKNYQITYYKPDENKIKTPDNSYSFLNDTTYVRWTTNGYGSGYVYRNTFHAQPYYPRWISTDEIHFTGTKLANNYVDESGTGSYFVQYSYPWGYADNAPNSDEMSKMNIEWAVNADGNPVHLPAVDFIKIYTGVNQYCGWLGETSTEILGVTDLHPEAVLSSIDNQSVRVSLLRKNDFLLVQNLEKVSQISIYDLKGILVTTTQNSQSININSLPDGIFIVKIVDTSGNQHIEKIFIN